ncbi:hypothetical protein [Nonomuraea candida]|uniref:hypothetical protein n=1 Tax=Nonomuraea candida TaxID=359159 RepID=UPI0012FB2664|nr:hypothetical protein [Nonomuraea candida]
MGRDRVAEMAGLALVLIVLAEGGVYWWLTLAQLSSRSPGPGGDGGVSRADVARRPAQLTARAAMAGPKAAPRR